MCARIRPVGTTARVAAKLERPAALSRTFSQQPCLCKPQTPLPPASPLTTASTTPSSHNSPVPTSVAGFLAWTPAEAVSGVAIHGFVRSVRTMKKYTFVTLGDGSSLTSLQAVVPAALFAASSNAEITNGAAVRLRGAWTPSPGAGQSHELHVTDFAVLGPSDAKTFPIQKKYQTPEFLRTLPHLRPRVPFNTTLLRFRSDVIASLTRFFTERRFVQTHPPLITSSDCEGAGEVFTVAGGAASNQANKQQAGEGSFFFRSDKYLTVSTQLHLEALSQALGNVWTLSPTFRAEESDTPRHLSEFYMLEAEVGFADRMDEVMDLVEDMLRFVAGECRGSRTYNELLSRVSTGNAAANDLEEPKTVDQRWAGLLSHTPWPRITYAEALRLLQDAPVAFEHAPVWEQGLMTEHERYLARIVGGVEKTPVFVTHYPRVSKAFYMLPTERLAGSLPGTDTVDCFDLLVPEFCEIAGGSMREHRLDQLLATMQARGMACSPGGLDWYVDLRRWGCPPHGGFGMGFDRLLCYLTGVQTIRDTVAFPRWYGRCDC
ncbi:MAG: asparaginyl-tRNA synthetase [Sporothrix epigloea]